MDMFGIGNAIKASLQIIGITARQTGRTTLLVESLKDGDRVLTPTDREAARLRALIAERRVSAEVVVVSAQRFAEYVHTTGSLPGEGRLCLDHTLVEDIYRRNIEGTEEFLDTAVKRLSGYGAAHRETRRRAEEMTRWEAVWPRM